MSTPCPACNNTGWVDLVTREGGEPFKARCETCHGSGVLIDETPPPTFADLIDAAIDYAYLRDALERKHNIVSLRGPFKDNMPPEIRASLNAERARLNALAAIVLPKG